MGQIKTVVKHDNKRIPDDAGDLDGGEIVGNGGKSTVDLAKADKEFAQAQATKDKAANKAKAADDREGEAQADEEAISEGMKAKQVEKRDANSVTTLKAASVASKEEGKKDKGLKLPAAEADRKEEGEADDEAEGASQRAEKEDGAKPNYLF